MAHHILPLIPLLRERVHNIRQQLDQAYAGLSGLLCLRDRNLILAQLNILQTTFMAIHDESQLAVNDVDSVLREYEGEGIQ